MAIRTDIIRVYKDVHGWVGICSGIALFIAFYAGALTMFEDVIQRWASPPPALAAAPSLERSPELIAKVLEAHPEAARSFDVHVALGPEQPARLSWTVGDAEHGPASTFYASLDTDGALQVAEQGPSGVAQWIDVLHQQVGLPFPHEIAMPIMGVVALLYAMALVSGVIILLPSLIKDLFAVRIGRNVKRMWLDIHNVLGLFSLPFHIVMALSAIVFAFHDQFYMAQGAVAPPPAREARAGGSPAPEARAALSPAEIVARLQRQAPGFEPLTLGFQKGPRGESVRVTGRDTRYPMRGATFGVAVVDPYSGAIKSSDYMPGLQSAGFAVLSSFFALHFGNFGGPLVQWSYFLLGLGGAFLFYTGNLLWIESRRRRERKAGPVAQSRSTRVLAGLTVCSSLGCVAGISVTLAAAKILPLFGAATTGWHQILYYAPFLAMTAWAVHRGAARSSAPLMRAAALACLAVPAASALALIGIGWNHGGATWWIDITAVAGAVLLFYLAPRAAQRAAAAPKDSVWSAEASAQAA